MDLDTTVKLNIYETVAQTTRLPTSAQVAVALGASVEEVEASFGRLHQRRLVVPEPGDPSRLRMAPPFSGIETPFRVTVQGRTYFANCAWDALGIPAALHQAGIVRASDGLSGEDIILDIGGSGPLPEPCVVHFAVPAARWWADIVFT